MSEVQYDWDVAKRLANIDKHGFDFRDAHEIFAGPMLIRLDSRFEYGEERWIGLGFLKEIVVVVIYTESEEVNSRRIISLRKALNYERKRFEEYFTN